MQDRPMYAIADVSHSYQTQPLHDPVELELEEIEDLRQRAMANRDILYCSPAARHLVEQEIPRLIGIIRQLRRTAPDGGRECPSARWAHGILGELRQEVGILRDLIDRK